MLGTNPCVPLTFKGAIVDQSGIATVFVLFVVVLDSLEIAIRMDVGREDENASRVRIAEVCGSGDGEGPNKDGLADTDRVSGQRDWNDEQLLFLIVFACLHDVRDGTCVKPKRITSIGKGELIWV